MARIYAYLVAVSVWSVSGWAECGLDASAREVVRTGSGYTKFFSLTLSNSAMASGHSPSRRLADYQAWVRRNTSWSARQGLANLLRIYENSGLERDPAYQDSIYNLRLVINRKAGRIGAMNCLEQLIFEEFLNVADLRHLPSEAHALILRKGSSLVVLGDFYARSMERGTSASATSTKEMRRLLAKGYRLWMLYHNHPYDFKNKYGDIGGNLAPSEPDIASCRFYRPEMAVITNGIETIRLKAADFSKFRLPRGY